MKKQWKFNGNILWRIMLALWALTVVLPILFIVYESLRTNQEFFASAWSFPKRPAIENFVRAWSSMGIGSAMLNTIYLIGLSIVIGLFVSVVNAYVFTRLEWKGRKLLFGIIMLTLFLPGINALIPQYQLMKLFHLSNSLSGLIVLYSTQINAFDLLVLGSFMGSIPREMEESAKIDGATIFQAFRKIIVPLSVPGIVTIGIFKFLGLYNDFLSPFIYLSDEKKYTIGVRMYHANIWMQYGLDWTGLLAGVIIAMIPSLLVFIIFQRHIVEGATLGALKG
jgi:N-acetylglucosamine transport system permease protein